MSKVVFITDNNEEIRKKLREAGFSVCICASFSDSIWLCYHPDLNMSFDIHGLGYYINEELDLTPLQRVNKILEESKYPNKEVYKTVEEFLEHYENERM